MATELSPMLAELREHVNRLHGLLAAPEPGLFTWSNFVGREWKAIAEAWTGSAPATSDVINKGSAV